MRRTGEGMASFPLQPCSYKTARCCSLNMYSVQRKGPATRMSAGQTRARGTSDEQLSLAQPATEIFAPYSSPIHPQLNLRQTVNTALSGSIACQTAQRPGLAALTPDAALTAPPTVTVLLLCSSGVAVGKGYSVRAEPVTSLGWILMECGAGILQLRLCRVLPTLRDDQCRLWEARGIVGCFSLWRKHRGGNSRPMIRGSGLRAARPRAPAESDVMWSDDASLCLCSADAPSVAVEQAGGLF